ncbi:MAG: hypothetical protein M3093_02665 [Thermoproteota archaeon]|nr:hypothetical protein [Thermoproteota archaeon]
MSTDYNRASYRTCGSQVIIAKFCHHFNEPTVRNWPQCLAIYDSLYVHSTKQRRPEEGEEKDLKIRVEIKSC